MAKSWVNHGPPGPLENPALKGLASQAIIHIATWYLCMNIATAGDNQIYHSMITSRPVLITAKIFLFE